MYVCMSQVAKHVCMYVCLCGASRSTPLTIQTRSAWVRSSRSRVCMYVCLRHTYIHAQLPEAYIHTRSAAWDIHTYIHTYIHTHSLFARRINIDFNSCATHRIEIPKRTPVCVDVQKTTKISLEIELCGFNATAPPEIKTLLNLLLLFG